MREASHWKGCLLHCSLPCWERHIIAERGISLERLFAAFHHFLLALPWWNRHLIGGNVPVAMLCWERCLICTGGSVLVALLEKAFHWKCVCCLALLREISHWRGFLFPCLTRKAFHWKSSGVINRLEWSCNMDISKILDNILAISHLAVHKCPKSG